MPLISVTGPDPTGVAVLQLQRPTKRNALSIALRDEMSDALESLGVDDDLRVLVITGGDEMFSAGFDLEEFAVADLADELWESSDRWHRDLLTFPLPTVAAVGGPALGGGFDLAVMCDVRVASDTARFAHPEHRFSQVVYGPLHDLVGGAWARDLALTGRTLDAAEALALGLVSRVVPAGDLQAEAAEVAREIALAPRDVLDAHEGQDPAPRRGRSRRHAGPLTGAAARWCPRCSSPTTSRPRWAGSSRTSTSCGAGSPRRRRPSSPPPTTTRRPGTPRSRSGSSAPRPGSSSRPRSWPDASTRWRPRSDAGVVFLDPMLPLGHVAHRLHAAPTVVVAHGAEVTVYGRLPVTGRLGRRVLRGAAGVVAAGEFAARQAARVADAPLPTLVLPPGVDLNRFGPADPDARRATRTRHGLDPDRPLVLGVSRLVPRKGFDVLLDAVAGLPDVQVAIVGKRPGPPPPRAAGPAGSAPGPGSSAGSPTTSCPAIYACADVFAMLCRTRWGGLEAEGFGIVFLEAAACGVPAVAGRSGGSHEAVVDGETGRRRRPDRRGVRPRRHRAAPQRRRPPRPARRRRRRPCRARLHLRRPRGAPRPPRGREPRRPRPDPLKAGRYAHRVAVPDGRTNPDDVTDPGDGHRIVLAAWVSDALVRRHRRPARPRRHRPQTGRVGARPGHVRARDRRVGSGRSPSRSSAAPTATTSSCRSMFLFQGPVPRRVRAQLYLGARPRGRGRGRDRHRRRVRDPDAHAADRADRPVGRQVRHLPAPSGAAMSRVARPAGRLVR